MTEYPDINQQIDLVISSNKRVDLINLAIKQKEIIALISREERLKEIYKIEPKDQDD